MTSASADNLISSPANPAVKVARRLARRPPRGGRELLVEGPQAVGEAVGCLRRVFVTQPAATRHAGLLHRARRAGARVSLCTEEVLSAITDTVTPQGIVAVATLPATDLDAVVPHARLLVVLWEVRDPGNLGTIVRTADAAGADGVVLAGDCVDPRNPKVVRSSAGSLFHLPVVRVGDVDELAQRCRSHGMQVLAADARGESVHTEADLAWPTALVFGNEAAGLPGPVLAACDRVIRVPIAASDRPGWTGSAESLNLAATVAVVSFEAARQAALTAGSQTREEAR